MAALNLPRTLQPLNKMAKKIQFKKGSNHHHINVGGRIITANDLTPELYDELIKLAPSHADLFDVTEEDGVQDTRPAKKAATV